MVDEQLSEWEQGLIDLFGDKNDPDYVFVFDSIHYSPMDILAIEYSIMGVGKSCVSISQWNGIDGDYDE